jgi:hypothetical protein
MSVPKSKGQELTARLEVLSKRSDVSLFEVRSLKRDIEKLVSVNAAEAYMLGGMLAAITGDHAESKELHERSLRLVADDVGYFNFGVSMKTVGDLTLAKKLFEKTAELVPGDLELFTHRMQTLVFLLEYEELELIVSDFKRANTSLDVDGLKIVKDARDFVKSVESLDISLGQIARVGRHIERALLSHKLSIAHMIEKISGFDGVSHVYLELHVEANSVDQLVDVNEHFMDLVLEDPAVEDWDKIVVNVVRRDHLHANANVEHSAA